MRVGATIFNQNYNDWDRYEAEEKGQSVAQRPAKSDREIFNEELNIARIADETGFDAVWTIEHHFTPYTMVTNPLQYLTYVAGITKRVDLGTMVVVLPWHNPVRVAEDVNMLDAFLGPKRNVVLGEWELPHDVTILGRVPRIEFSAADIRNSPFTESA